MAIKLRQESALNLTLEGSTGSFQVGKGLSGQNSIEVKYFLTYVGLGFSSLSNEALLSELAPVRDIFDFNSLDFDEIMHSDIDDARVSKELIPYLLDEKSINLIKLFPPIIVVVLPVEEDRNRPANLYPEVSSETVKQVSNDDHDERNTLPPEGGQPAEAHRAQELQPGAIVSDMLPGCLWLDQSQTPSGQGCEACLCASGLVWVE